MKTIKHDEFASNDKWHSTTKIYLFDDNQILLYIDCKLIQYNFELFQWTQLDLKNTFKKNKNE